MPSKPTSGSRRLWGNFRFARNLGVGERIALLITIAFDMLTFGTDSAAQVAKHVAQRPDHEFPFFSPLLQFTSCGGDLGSSCLDNVVR